MREVYTIDQLQLVKNAKLAVVGFPVNHSMSPEMHQAALDDAGINARYVRVEVPPGKVAEAFAKMRQLGFIGCNVTLPHKLEAMAACDEVEDEARLLGAVNTISFVDKGILGSNTDGPGLAKAVAENFGQPLESLKTMAIGAGGGAGRAIAMMCALRGVPELALVNRSVEKLAPLVERILEISPDTIVHVLPHGLSILEISKKFDLIINATSLGMKADDAPVLPYGAFHRGQFVYDAVYSPPMTQLLRSAGQAGCLTANGLSMLLHQGALAFRTWFPESHPLEPMRRALAGCNPS